MFWRRRAESNRRTGLCRPLPKPLGHAAKAPGDPIPPTGMLRSAHADRTDRPALDPRPPAPLRRDRAGRRPAGPRPAGRRPRRAAVHHRRLDLPGAPPVGAARGRGPADRHGRARAAPRAPRLRGRARVRRRPRPHAHGPAPRSALPRISRWSPPSTGPFNEELTDLYRATSGRVPLIAISARPAPGRPRDPGGPGDPPRDRGLPVPGGRRRGRRRRPLRASSSAGWPTTRAATGPSRWPGGPACAS